MNSVAPEDEKPQPNCWGSGAKNGIEVDGVG